MNENKRKWIDTIISQVEILQGEEQQDLKDTPDNIENSGEVRQKFTDSIFELGAAIQCLTRAKR